MKAVTITAAGGPEVLQISEVATPPLPTADRVRVRVRAAGLNRADVYQRRGYYPAPPGYPQNIPGLEFAGEVEAVFGIWLVPLFVALAIFKGWDAVQQYVASVSFAVDGLQFQWPPPISPLYLNDVEPRNFLTIKCLKRSGI